MTRVFVAPRRYVQGPNELRNFGEHVKRLGSRPFIIAIPDDFERVGESIVTSSIDAGITHTLGPFRGELTREEARRLALEAQDANADVIVGLGGGKACDAAKAVADQLNLANVIIPTVASTDAPCSSLAVFYSEAGVFESGDLLRNNPDLVLVDSQVIARAPTRFLVSGFGDALATYFEARAAHSAGALNVVGGRSTLAALAIARACIDTLLKQSAQAVAASEANEVTEPLEDVIEANVLLSGLGFESGGLAAAHSIHNGLTSLDGTHHLLHGEKVAFGIVVQLTLESADSELDEVLMYLDSVGLPTSLSAMGLEANRDTARAIAEASMGPAETIHNMPMSIDLSGLTEAILSADRQGVARARREY